jgi:hypothetical protein
MIFLLILAVAVLIVVARRGQMAGAVLITLVAVVVTGSAAGAVVSPAFFLATILVAGVIIRAAHKPRATEATTYDGLLNLPPALRAIVTDAVNSLPTGEARQMLIAVCTQADALYAAPSGAFDASEDRATHRHVHELVEACCVSAIELARLDRVMAASPARSTRAPGAAATPSGEVDQKLASARQVLVRRLSDAKTALRALYAADVEHGTEASLRVAHLATEIKSDAAARSAAIADVNSLLS